MNSLFFLAFTLIGALPGTAPPPPLPPINQNAPQPKPKLTPINRAPAAPVSTGILESIYTSPGVATLQDGKWVGNEHLFNLSKDVGIVVEIIKPTGADLSFSEADLRQKVAASLSEGGFTPKTTFMASQSPLPFIHVLVMINPIENGYVAYCAIRLFEATKVERVHLKLDLTWQTITWEKQELLVVAAEQLKDQMMSVFDTLAKSFAERFKSYQSQTNKA